MKVLENVKMLATFHLKSGIILNGFIMREDNMFIDGARFMIFSRTNDMENRSIVNAESVEYVEFTEYK